MGCCTVLNAARGFEASCVCGSVCLYNAFHVPHISLPFISSPLLCCFGGGVQSASRISFQLVLVQILILKGGLTNLASEKTRGENRREGGEEEGSCGGDTPLLLFTLQLTCWIVLQKKEEWAKCVDYRAIGHHWYRYRSQRGSLYSRKGLKCCSTPAPLEDLCICSHTLYSIKMYKSKPPYCECHGQGTDDGIDQSATDAPWS